jgi:hypothetical protein
MPKIDKPKRDDDHPEKSPDDATIVASSDAPLVDSALAGIREKRARQAAAVGTARPRRGNSGF